jgi:hypothetical protein
MGNPFERMKSYFEAKEDLSIKNEEEFAEAKKEAGVKTHKQVLEDAKSYGEVMDKKLAENADNTQTKEKAMRRIEVFMDNGGGSFKDAAILSEDIGEEKLAKENWFKYGIWCDRTKDSFQGRDEKIRVYNEGIEAFRKAGREDVAELLLIRMHEKGYI